MSFVSGESRAYDRSFRSLILSRLCGQQAGAGAAAAPVPTAGAERIIGTKRLYADGKFNTKDGKAIFMETKWRGLQAAGKEEETEPLFDALKHEPSVCPILRELTGEPYGNAAEFGFPLRWNLGLSALRWKLGLRVHPYYLPLETAVGNP